MHTATLIALATVFAYPTFHAIRAREYLRFYGLAGMACFWAALVNVVWNVPRCGSCLSE